MANRAGPDAPGKRKRDDLDESEDADVKLEVISEAAITLDDVESDSDDEYESEEDGSEDDEDCITGECRYYESSEAYPSCVAYDEAFTRIGQSLINIPAEVMTIIDESGCKSARAQSCRDNAQELARIPRSRREKIALLGNTGVGKSSLLNCLLDVPKMAKAMAAGQSCTHVPTEYESPFPGQTTKFAAQVEYFDPDEIKKLLQKLLQDYNTWHFERPDDMEQDEEKELKTLASTAFDAFLSLFCDHLEMASPSATTEYLDGMYTDPDTDTIKILSGWCATMLEDRRDDENEYTEYISEDNKDDFLQKLKPLVFSTSVQTEPALWPLVKRVRVGIDGPRILDHVVLVDLPGIDDTNRVRANACLDILKTCGSIWIVTKINRAVTDTAVDNLLWRYGKVYNVAVICTGIDDNLDPGLAHFLASEGQSIGDHDELLTREKRLRKLSKRYPKMIESRRAKLEGRNRVRDKRKRAPQTEAAKEKLRAELVELEKELSIVEDQLPKVALERFELLVDARSAFTTRRLTEDTAEYLPPQKTLKVFCVSNVHYDALKGARIVPGPCLPAQGTGIPAIRSFVLRASAPYLQTTVENYISHKFTVFMQGLAMWANSYAVAGGVEILEAVEKRQKRVDPLLQRYHKVLMEFSDKIITEPLAGDLSTLIEKAKSALEKKRKWHWSTVRAFVRKEGNHHTSVAPKQSWNEGFMEGATETVKKHWEQFIEKQTKLQKQLLEKLQGIVQDIAEYINGDPAMVSLPMERLRGMLVAQQHGIEQACNEHAEALENDLRNIFLDLTQDRYSGYFTQAMLEVYEKCKLDRGPGVKNRTLANLDVHLSQEGKKSLFSVTCKKLTNAISKDTKAKNKALSRKTEDILKEIHRQISEIMEQKTDDTAEEWLRVNFREFLARAGPEFEDIKGNLMELKASYGVRTTN